MNSPTKRNTKLLKDTITYRQWTERSFNFVNGALILWLSVAGRDESKQRSRTTRTRAELFPEIIDALFYASIMYLVYSSIYEPMTFPDGRRAL